MSPLPWLPGGVSELPAARFLLFADDTHVVQRIDESALQLAGVSFTGVWETGRLNAGSIREVTLRYLTLVYMSQSNSTITVKASGDGGTTWEVSVLGTIAASTDDRLQRKQFGFNVTGYDLRVRIELDQNVLFTIHELHPVIAARGQYVSG